MWPDAIPSSPCICMSAYVQCVFVFLQLILTFPGRKMVPLCTMVTDHSVSPLTTAFLQLV